MSYDPLGRVLTKTFPAAPAEDVAYSYDDTTGGNHGVGRLTGFDDASGSTAYHYDALGRVVEVSQTIAGDAFTTEYGYDAAGRVAEMTYPSGRVVTFTRDSTGRVTDVATKANASATPETVATDVEYLPFHPAGLFADGAAAPGLDMPHLDGLAGFTHGNGLAVLLNYDADGRLTGMNTADGLTEVQDLTLAYDAAADITAITDNLDPTRNQTFDYDGVGRLTWASGAYGEIDYSYDLVGNRTHRTIDDGTITDEVYAYGAGSHRLESVTVGASTRDFAYTAVGSTASDSRAGTPLAFAYNFAGRLESVTAASGTLASREYSYDALQHRVREVKEDRVGGGIQTSAVSYVYDLDGHLIAEAATLGSTPTVRREYIWIGDTPVGVVDHTVSGDPLLAIHTDHLGRPQKLTDASQAVVWDGQFDPFGEERAVAGTTDLLLRFPGQEWDAATGLSQNWNRDYDPSLGRYIESDPIGLLGGMSTYGYANAGPLKNVDRNGLYTIALGPQTTTSVGGLGITHMANPTISRTDDRRAVDRGTWNSFAARPPIRSGRADRSWKLERVGGIRPAARAGVHGHARQGRSQAVCRDENAGGRQREKSFPRKRRSLMEHSCLRPFERERTVIGLHVASVSGRGRGQPTSIDDPNGVATAIEHDPLDRATSVTRNPGPDEVVTELEYNAVGDNTKIIRPDGSWLAYTYDDTRRFTSIASDLGETITYGYNNASDVTSVDVRTSTGIIVASRTLAYDEIGRVRRLIGADLLFCVGWSWIGTKYAGRSVFRIAIGHRKRWPGHGFPWHFP